MSLGTCLWLTVLVLAAPSRAVEQARIDWLAEHAVPFDTVEADHGFQDLAPLKEMIGGARVVGLGEGTHGTREHFQLKHRLVEYLATELGFTLFAIEACMPESQALDPYVRGGEGDPGKLIGGMYFWTWHTEEVLAMVEWMRAHNAAGGDLGFTGFDMQTPDVAMAKVVAFLEVVDPAFAGEARETYKRATGTKRSKFGTGRMTFPIEQARGKRVRFSGWIRTDNVREGRAGLWWRIDGPERKTILGFDNMMDRGPSGTTDWAEYAIEMDVPQEAVNINFGVILSALGTAWFDDLQVSLDGEPFDDPQWFDFDYEGETIPHYATYDAEFRGELDASIAHSGRQSFRLVRLEPVLAAGDEPDDAARAAEEIHARMIAESSSWSGRVPEDEMAWAIQNARVAAQCLVQRAAGPQDSQRDSCMAENVLWLLSRDPEARIVLWAHNGHVSRNEGWMGSFLARELGDVYLPVGFTAGGGRYAAIGEDGLGPHDLLPPPTDSVEAVLAATGEALLMLDLREADSTDPVSAWLHGDLFMLSIGAMATPWQYHRQPVAKNFDLLMWVADTTPAVQIPWE